MATVEEKLALANKHLAKVQVAWDPPNWLELSLFGFYALEAAVDAADDLLRIERQEEPPRPSRGGKRPSSELRAP